MALPRQKTLFIVLSIHGMTFVVCTDRRQRKGHFPSETFEACERVASLTHVAEGLEGSHEELRALLKLAEDELGE